MLLLFFQVIKSCCKWLLWHLNPLLDVNLNNWPFVFFSESECLLSTGRPHQEPLVILNTRSYYYSGEKTEVSTSVLLLPKNKKKFKKLLHIVAESECFKNY